MAIIITCDWCGKAINDNTFAGDVIRHGEVSVTGYGKWKMTANVDADLCNNCATYLRQRMGDAMTRPPQAAKAGDK